MLDRCHPIPAAARFAASAAAELRRWRWLRGLIVGPAALLASCRSGGVVDPRGPIASAEWLLVINATEIMLVTLDDLAQTIARRAEAGADQSYTRSLPDKGPAHCARKL